MVYELSNALRRGIEPLDSFTGARDYARSAVASWTSKEVIEVFFIHAYFLVPKT